MSRPEEIREINRPEEISEVRERALKCGDVVQLTNDVVE